MGMIQQSRKPLVLHNFLMQVIKELKREDDLSDLTLTNREDLVRDMKVKGAAQKGLQSWAQEIRL